MFRSQPAGLALLLLLGLPGFLPAEAPTSPPSTRAIDFNAIPASDPLILQWFEAGWSTMYRRMGDAFVAGYTGLWVPPPGRGSGDGNFIGQIGYDLYDRFDFGQKTSPTRYGDTRTLTAMVDQARKAGIATYYDSVMNHNGSGTHANSGFVNSGGYPGFAMSFGSDQWGDFNPPGGSDDLTGYLAGLIDIDQSKNHQMIRQPAVPAANNVPGAGVRPNQPITFNHRRFYPDTNPAPGDVLTPSGFNLTNPLGGDPVPENATGLLLRYTAYMNEVVGFDGIRIDAVKHIPQWYFNNLWDQAIANKGRRRLDGSTTTPFSFGEAFTGDEGLLMAYHNRTAPDNRTVLDFRHYFSINEVFNAGGSQDLRRAIWDSLDDNDGNAFDGSAGVYFLASHDKDGGGGSNIGNFWVAMRKGHSVIYHNAKQFPTVQVNGNPIDFPKSGGSRGDALGDFKPDAVKDTSLIAVIADIRNRFARGNWRERWIDPDYLVLEYEGRLLYGLSDRSSSGFFTQTVTTGFPPGTVLEELTGNAVRYNTRTNTSSIPQTITVGSGGSATIRIPYNSDQYGYVAYGPVTPTIEWSLSNIAETRPPDTEASQPASALRRQTPVYVVRSGSSTLNVTTNGTEVTCLVSVSDRDINNNGVVDIRSGGLAGFENFTTARTGSYSQTIDWSRLGDGYHFVEVVAVKGGGAGEHPAVWSSKRFVVFVDNERPRGTFVSPPANTVVTGATTLDVRITTDGTEDNALVNSAPSFVADRPTDQFTQMLTPGRNEWYLAKSVGATDRVITVRLFEETGAYRDVVLNLIGSGEPTPTPTVSPTSTVTPTPSVTPGPSPTGATPTTTATPTPSPTPGEVINIPFINTVQPVIDGTVNQGEYSPGGVLVAINPDPLKNSFGNNNQIGAVYLANDNENLYIAFDGFKLEGQPNAFVMYLDTTIGATGNANFGAADVGKLADYGPPSTPNDGFANNQEALSVGLNASTWPSPGNIRFSPGNAFTADFGFVVSGTQAQSRVGLPADNGTVGLFGFPELGSTTPTTDFWFLDAQFAGGTTEDFEVRIPFSTLRVALAGNPVHAANPIGPDNAQNTFSLVGFFLNGDNGDTSDEFIPAQAGVTGTTVNDGSKTITLGAPVVFRLGRSSVVTPTPTVSPTPSATPSPSPTPDPNGFVVNGIQAGTEAYRTASNSAAGIDTNTKFGFGDSAKTERLVASDDASRLYVFAEGSLHSGNKFFLLVDSDANPATGWSGRHPNGEFGESNALEFFTDVADGGYDLTIALGTDGANPPTELFCTVLAYNADGTLAEEKFLGSVTQATGGSTISAIVRGQPGSISFDLEPGDGANNGIELTVPRAWLLNGGGVAPGSFRLVTLNGNGPNNFWSNSTIPQNSLAPDANIGFTPGTNDTILATLTAPVFPYITTAGTPTPSPTPTQTPAPTQTEAPTLTPSPTATATTTPTASPTGFVTGTPSPTPSASPTASATATASPTATPSPTPDPNGFTINGSQGPAEAYTTATNSAAGIDTNTKFGFGDSAKVERLVAANDAQRLFVFAEGSLHSGNKLMVLVDSDANATTGWSGRHPNGNFGESNALEFFTDVADGGYDLTIAIGSEGSNPTAELFCTVLAYNADGSLADEQFVGSVTLPTTNGTLTGTVRGNLGTIEFDFVPGDGANDGIEMAIPRAWLLTGGGSAPASFRLVALNGNGDNTFWSNSTIPQNNLGADVNIGFTPGTNDDALAALTAPVFAYTTGGFTPTPTFSPTASPTPSPTPSTTVTPTPGVPLATPGGPDTDGDGFSDAIENALGSSPNDATDRPAFADFDGNDNVDVRDALALARAVGEGFLSPYNALLDVTGDGRVDAADARTLLRWTFGEAQTIPSTALE